VQRVDVARDTSIDHRGRRDQDVTDPHAQDDHEHDGYEQTARHVHRYLLSISNCRCGR
jgi:hypothetical protein